MDVVRKNLKDSSNVHKKFGRMTERFKVADCKSVRFFPIIGSNPISFKKLKINFFEI